MVLGHLELNGERRGIAARLVSAWAAAGPRAEDR